MGGLIKENFIHLQYFVVFLSILQYHNFILIKSYCIINNIQNETKKCYLHKKQFKSFFKKLIKGKIFIISGLRSYKKSGANKILSPILKKNLKHILKF